MFDREFYFSSAKGCVSTFNFNYKIASEETTSEAIKAISLELMNLGRVEVALSINFKEIQYRSTLKEKLKNNFNIITANDYTSSLLVRSRDGTINNCKLIIDYLKEQEGIDDATYEMLQQDLNFPITQDRVKAMLIETADKDIAEAKAKAFKWDSFECRKALWDLAEYLKNQGEHQDAMELYQHIPEDNPCYKDAQLAMKEIILWMFQAHQDHKIELSPDEIKKYKEDLLILSIHAEDTQYATQLFFELSGMPMRTDYPKIKTDAETLVMISREMLKLNKEITDLKREIKNKPIRIDTLFNPKEAFIGYGLGK